MILTAPMSFAARPSAEGREDVLIVTVVCALLLPWWCAILGWYGMSGLLLVP